MSTSSTHHARRPLLMMLAILCAAVLTALAAAAGASAAECPNEAIRTEQGATMLPDCRAFELASPELKNGQEVETAHVVQFQVPFQAAAEGRGIAFLASGGLPGSESGGLYTQYKAQRPELTAPWNTISLNPESRNEVIEGPGPRTPGNFDYYSPNLGCGVEATRLPLARHPGTLEEPELGEGETSSEQVTNLYKWNAEANSYTLVTKPKPTNASQIPVGAEGIFHIDGASSDCSEGIFESEYQFHGAPAGSIYKWVGQTIEVASVLPDGKAAETVIPLLSGNSGSTVNRISSDGKTVFFEALADAGPDAGKIALFARTGSTTVEVSAPAGGPAASDSGARFQAATADGKRVFFIASYGLTKTTSSGEEAATECKLNRGTGCDLYEYNLETKALTDLSADVQEKTGDKLGADVRGVLGTSEDGSYVYFSAAGQLVAGKGKSQVENIAQETASVYVYRVGLHPESALSYVTTIKAIEAGDAPGPLVNSVSEVDALSPGQPGNEGSSPGQGIGNLQARVSPSGQYLLLATRAPVQEYRGATAGETFNNEDKNVVGQHDWEQYEYSLGATSLTCVTCGPKTGETRTQQPIEAKDEPDFGPLGPFENVRDGAIQRNLLDDGRVFFQTYSPLLPEATTATLHAYEWAPEGVGSCASGSAIGCVGLLDNGVNTFPTYLAGASADGENVYITSHTRLAPQDEDGLRDLYDVRVGGGIVPTTVTHGCATEECPEPLPGPLGGSTHDSESGVGGGQATPVPTHEVLGSTMGKAIVRRHSVKGSALTLVIFTNAAGRLTISGSGLTTGRISVRKAGTYTVRVSLGARGRAAIRHHRRVRVTVHIAFVPTAGRSSSGSFAVAFR